MQCFDGILGKGIKDDNRKKSLSFMVEEEIETMAFIDEDVDNENDRMMKDADTIEYSCEYCPYKTVDSTKIEIHTYKKHKSNK